MNGWGELGFVLGGGGKRNPDAYQSGLRSAADGEYALARAAREQAERMMVDRQNREIERLMSDPALQGELGWNAGQTALFGASERGNFGQNTQGQLNLQEQAMRAQAQRALTPELGEGNATLAAIAGKPVERVKVQGDMVFDPYVQGGDMEVTELGRAKIAKQGRVSDYNSQAVATDQGLFAFDPRTHQMTPLVGDGGVQLTRPPTGSADPNAAIEKMLAEQTFGVMANPDMSPEQQTAAVARLKAAADQMRGKPNTTAAPQAGTAAPKSKAEYDALPSGARFTAPDGTTRIKP